MNALSGGLETRAPQDDRRAGRTRSRFRLGLCRQPLHISAFCVWHGELFAPSLPLKAARSSGSYAPFRPSFFSVGALADWNIARPWSLNFCHRANLPRYGGLLFWGWVCQAKDILSAYEAGRWSL